MKYHLTSCFDFKMSRSVQEQLDLLRDLNIDLQVENRRLRQRVDALESQLRASSSGARWTLVSPNEPDPEGFLSPRETPSAPSVPVEPTDWTTYRGAYPNSPWAGGPPVVAPAASSVAPAAAPPDFQERESGRYYCVIRGNSQGRPGIYNRKATYRVAVSTGQDPGFGSITFARESESRAFDTIREAENYFLARTGQQAQRINWK